ncbi:hypothetical protein GCM10027343_39020 [Noviherbaspirillum agri]
MNSEQAKPGVAQPAEESLKKHGDQLEKPVEQAAGTGQHDSQHESADSRQGKSAGA